MKREVKFMKHKFTKKITAILAVILAAVIFLTIPVSAIEVTGNGSGGGSSSTTSGGSYKLPVLGSSTSYCAGYRLTVITANGVRRNGTSTIDVYCSNSDFANHIKNNAVYYSSGLYYKTEISSGFISGGGTDKDIGNTKFNSGAAIWNSSIPQDAVQMTNSATGGTPYFKTDTGSDVLDNLLIKMGLSGTDALQNGNKVLIEPIFLLEIANTEYLLTVTEIGLYGFKMFGDVVPASRGDTGSWANIAYYTNAYWPMSCRITEDLSYNGTPIWYAAGTLTTGNPGRGSFGDLIRRGYGVAFAYNNTNPPTVPVDLYPTSVTYWTSQTGGSQVTNLVEGGTYWPRFTYHNNGSIAVNATVSIWSYPLAKYDSQNKSITIGANSDYTVYSNYSITIKQGLCFGTSGNTYTDYTYTQNTLVYKLDITLDDSKATESDTSNNTGTYTNNFSPIQPSMSQNFLDDENSGSSWITNAVNNKIIYSGQEVKGRVDLLNRSSFGLNVLDLAKAALGLESNNTYNYLNPPGTSAQTVLHSSGANWSNITSKFRAKNIPVDVSSNNSTQKTLYLLSAAGEKSYLNATGTNISNLDLLANNLELNNKVFFSNTTFTNGGNNLTQSWDNNTRILTLNGQLNNWANSGYSINYNFKNGETYKITVEYVSGSVTAERPEGKKHVASCMVFNFSSANGPRLHSDILYPNLKVDNRPKTDSGYITMTRNESTMYTWLWIDTSVQSSVFFNNYKVKIKIEQIAKLESNLKYSTNIEGYSLIPTDLETSSIGLYDADTGERLDESVKLKAGQQVYSETTYKNNTDTAVAVSLDTKHDNNSNTEYYMVDEENIENFIDVNSNEIPLENLFASSGTVSTGGSYSYDKNTGILTLNGKYSNNSRKYVSFPAIDYSLSVGERYRMSVEYISGSALNDEGINMGLMEGTTTLGWTSSLPYYDFQMPHTSWTQSDITSTELEVQAINGSTNDCKLIIGIVCNGTNTSFDNMKLKISIEKVNPSVSWDEGAETLTINGDYSENRNIYVREFNPLYNGSSSDGKVRYNFSSGSDKNSELTITLNGTINGSDYMHSLFSHNMNLLGGMDNLKAGDKIRISTEYVSGSVIEPAATNFVVMPISQYDSNGTRHSFADLTLPKTVYCSNNSTSSILTISNCSNLTSDYLQMGLHSRNIVTGNATNTTFNNYTIKLHVEIISKYSSVNNTVISSNIPIGDYDNYLLKLKNLEGSITNGTSSIVVEYFDDRSSVIDVQEINLPTTGETVSIGIACPDTSVKTFRVILKSDTGEGEKIVYNNLKLNLTLTKKGITQCNIASDYNSEHIETCVIAPNDSVIIRSNVFTVSALPHNKIDLSAYIYIKGLVDNTEYEYDKNNNVKSTSYEIETPFKPTIIQANSEYRRGITVITSFNIKNDSYLDFGNQVDIDNLGELSANLKIYKNASLTGNPIANVNCIYAVPGNGNSTLVWFEWTVPVDSPDKLYAIMVCDNNNIYSSEEFVDNGNNSKNVYCTFNIVQPKVTSTPDTTFSKSAPYWYVDGFSTAAIPGNIEGLGAVYNQTASQIKYDTSWSYYIADGENLKLVTENATLMGSTVDLIPDGSISAYIGEDNKWNIKSGYGFKIDTEFKDNINSTNVQSGYAVFPEFLYKIIDDNTQVNGYTNGTGTRIGFEGVLNKYPLCGGEYATYSTFEKTKNGKLILPNNDSSNTPTHFIPIWYPNSDYRITCYVADCWTPGGMLSGRIKSSKLHINGNMYDDYRVSEK